MSITSILYRTSAGSPTRSWSDVGVLLVPEQFAKIQRQAGDGPIGQEFFKACATWVWALLKHQHDPQLPNAAGMCVCVCVCRFSLTAREVSSTWNPLISPISRVLGRPGYHICRLPELAWSKGIRYRGSSGDGSRRMARVWTIDSHHQIDSKLLFCPAEGRPRPSAQGVVTCHAEGRVRRGSSSLDDWRERPASRVKAAS